MRKFQLEEEINTDADNESSDDAKAEVIAAASPNKKMAFRAKDDIIAAASPNKMMTFRDKVLAEPKYES